MTLAPGTLTVGLLTWAVARAASREGAEPDPLVGIRTRATKTSPRAWVAGHRAALPVARAGAVIAVAVALGVVVLAVLASTAPAPGTAAGVLAVVGFVAAVGCCSVAAVIADRAARAVVDGA